MPRTLKLTLTYDGSGFVGWQRQAEGVSIQGLLEDALSRIDGRQVAVVGAGRTDSGVHAVGQVASCVVRTALDASTLQRALNGTLPPEIRVIALEDAVDGFHARYSARSKTYRYQILNTRIVSPFDRRYAWQVTESLDVDAMAQAAALLEGEHDFAAFQSTGSSVRTSTRTVFRSEMWRPNAARLTPWDVALHCDERTRIIYEVTASGFLRHMVRAIVGTLVEIGAGRRDVTSLEHALASGERSSAGPTAPACGLCLLRVDYDRLSCHDGSQPLSS